MQKDHWRLWLGVSLLLVGLTGCGPSLHRVHGKVKFEGKTFPAGGSIVFIPLDGKGNSAAGEIAVDGTYELTTTTPKNGAPAGEYRVVITQVTAKEGGRTRDGEKPGADPTSLVAPADRIPALHSDHYQSPLTAKVEAKNPNEIHFPLKRQ